MDLITLSEVENGPINVDQKTKDGDGEGHQLGSADRH